MKDKSNMITSDHLIDIISHIPSLFHIGEWKLIYSTIKHGSLLKTLMRNCEDHSPLIIIIKDLDAYIFGAYLSEKLKYSS